MNDSLIRKSAEKKILNNGPERLTNPATEYSSKHVYKTTFSFIFKSMNFQTNQNMLPNSRHQ